MELVPFGLPECLYGVVLVYRLGLYEGKTPHPDGHTHLQALRAHIVVRFHANAVDVYLVFVVVEMQSGSPDGPEILNVDLARGC